jgi:hypothetical protein
MTAHESSSAQSSQVIALNQEVLRMAIALDLIRRICVQECHADLYWWSEVDKIAIAALERKGA